MRGFGPATASSPRPVSSMTMIVAALPIIMASVLVQAPTVRICMQGGRSEQGCDQGQSEYFH